jgi:hypothetical protein
MKTKNHILDLITEFADTPILSEGPNSVINKIKTKFRLFKKGESTMVKINSDISRLTYDLGDSQSNIRLSFLFHSLSQRWYIESVRPAL